MTSRGLFNHDWVFVAAADHSNVHLPSESISCSTLILPLLGESLPRSCRSRQLFNLLVSFSDFREAQESNIRLKSSFFSPSKFKDKRESLKILPQKVIFFNSNEGGFGQKSGRQNSVRPRGHNLSLSLSLSHSLSLTRTHTLTRSLSLSWAAVKVTHTPASKSVYTVKKNLHLQKLNSCFRDISIFAANPIGRFVWKVFNKKNK